VLGVIGQVTGGQFGQQVGDVGRRLFRRTGTDGGSFKQRRDLEEPRTAFKTGRFPRLQRLGHFPSQKTGHLSGHAMPQ